MEDVSAPLIRRRRPSKWRSKNVKPENDRRREVAKAQHRTPIMCKRGQHWCDVTQFDGRFVSGEWIRYAACQRCRA